MGFVEYDGVFFLGAHLTHKICESIRNSQPFNEVNGDPNKNHFVTKSLEDQITLLNTFYK